jgi:hypothetical protein
MACYANPADWRGLPAVDIVLEEQTGLAGADRRAFWELRDLAAYADAFAVVVSVREISRDGENSQTAILEYAETIGGTLDTLKWNDNTVSTGSRVLIQQNLIGGCTMSEPSNLVRKGGTYVLPLKFNEYTGVYNVVGDLDVLFELDDAGKMHSHSRFEELNKYDGYTLPDFLDEVRGLYPAKQNPADESDAQPEADVISPDQAYRLLLEQYSQMGITVTAELQAVTTLWETTEVYLFAITGDEVAQYAGIVISNGNLVRLEMLDDGGFAAISGILPQE